MEEALSRTVAGVFEDTNAVSNLHRLSGGASQETWSFDAGDRALILRRSPRGMTSGGSSSIGLNTEAILIKLARAHGVAAPEVHYVLTASDDLGTGYIMERVEGETIARKILRDEAFDAIRPKLAYQCAEAAAHIHAIPIAELPKLDLLGVREQLDRYRQLLDNYDYPHAVFELAFKYLEDRLPVPAEPRLVHGDFRHGNLMIHPERGVAAVLDWELAHRGDPMEDLGWVCTNSWRFGNIDKPVGGFGEYEELFAGYEAASGIKVEPERVKYWEIFGSLKWGIMCMTMYFVFNSGMDRTVERAAIGRRSSETEVDLMRLLTT